MSSPQQQGGGGLGDLDEVRSQLPSAVIFQATSRAGVMSQRLYDFLNSHHPPHHG